MQWSGGVAAAHETAMGVLGWRRDCVRTVSGQAVLLRQQGPQLQRLVQDHVCAAYLHQWPIRDAALSRGLSPSVTAVKEPISISDRRHEASSVYRCVWSVLRAIALPPPH